MTTLCNCGVTPKQILNLPQNEPTSNGCHDRPTHSIQHDFRLNTLREMESGTWWKYQRFYKQQHLAFASVVKNSLGQCGPDLLQLFWNIADHYTQTMFGFSLVENTPKSSAPSTQQAANYHELRGQKYNKNHQRVLTHIFEGITTLSLELLSTWPVPHRTPNGLNSIDTTGLPLFLNLTWIWFLLPEHHNLLISAIQFPALQLM